MMSASFRARSDFTRTVSRQHAFRTLRSLVRGSVVSMGVGPVRACIPRAVERDTETVVLPRFAGTRDDDVANFFFVPFADTDLYLVVNPEAEDELAAPWVILVVSQLLAAL